MTLSGTKIKFKESAKRCAITFGLEIANLLQKARVARQARGSGIIFTLHHVRAETKKAFSPNAHLEITPKFLELAIRTIVNEGYEPIDLQTIPERLRNGGDKPFAAFTLDDGYRNNLTDALPVFSRHQTPFTVFVTRGFALRTHTIWWETLESLIRQTASLRFDFGDGPVVLKTGSMAEKSAAFEEIGRSVIGMDEAGVIDRIDAATGILGINPKEIVESLVMSPDELKALATNPLATLGAHTASHRALSFLASEDALAELSQSADFVEELTGRRPSTFAYPYGFEPAVSSRDHLLAKEAGFDLAVLTRPGTLSAASLESPHALPRVSLNGLYQKSRYVSALASGLPFKLTG